MATIVLSAVGAAAGASIGGGVLGLSSVVIGRAIGAGLGRAIDQRLLGAGAQAVDTPQIETFRLMGASEGTPIGQVYGRMRVGGQVIWASEFEEHTETTGGGGGKGSRPSSPQLTTHRYTVSLALALCEGEIARVGRIWADGREINSSDLNMRIYTGSDTQLPDAKIEAVEERAPAYRGTAYVVIEDLDLTPYGNRVPQFNFEVIRPDQPSGGQTDMAHLVNAVALIPGTGEYALATEPVYQTYGLGHTRAANMNSSTGKPDFTASLEAMTGELSACGSTSLIVSWFGDDLRCGVCTLTPRVEQTSTDGTMPWQVSGLTRGSAQTVPYENDRPLYGGTPTDQSVLQAMRALKAAGQEVMFYPFILMTQTADNTLFNPWTSELGQPALPWRGRITTSLAPTQAGSPDGTPLADEEVVAFFGAAGVQDFTIDGEQVSYTGTDQGYRRMILHYAHLCALAGGVEAFCIGSEMRSLTHIRGAAGFPAVEELRRLAADVRSILGPHTKISYAADWSEYFGYQADGDLYYHLDPLWADENIDFIGIDNYMPLSDWRDGSEHADADWGAIYNLDYLKSNIEGGEGYEWYYAHREHEAAQIRTPITDGAYDEPWVWRYKDLRAWWENDHHARIGGVRQESPSAWVPKSKPIWFTELGCAAIDKGTNEPNKFLDPKSSESALPRASNGARDDFLQLQYLRAMTSYWAEHNPVSDVYDGPMIDMSRAHVWAWDARPYPTFPMASDLWSDSDNYARGHWLNGRSSNRSLADVVEEICARSDVLGVDTSKLWGVVRGYSQTQVDTARSGLQPLMLAYGFDAVERGGMLSFVSRSGDVTASVTPDVMALLSAEASGFERHRAPKAEVADRVQLSFIEADYDFTIRTEEAVMPEAQSDQISVSQMPLSLTRAEGRAITERWLAEARIARDGAQFALPPSLRHLGAGDVLEVDGARYRVDQVETGLAQELRATRIEPEIYDTVEYHQDLLPVSAFTNAAPVFPIFLDLPLLTGDEIPHAPHVAIAAEPWTGAAIYSSDADNGYTLNTLIDSAATVGLTATTLTTAQPDLWHKGAPLRVDLSAGSLSSASAEAVLNGANTLAIGDGSADNWEVVQFTTATLVGERSYELSGFLRGQVGTQVRSWPAGSYVVLLDAALRQIDTPLSARGLARHYRIGPKARPYDDPSYQHKQIAFDGIGLRPYAPAHLRLSRSDSGDLHASWVRRTRLDGDSWHGTDVPLGEASEAYLLRVVKDGVILREDNSTVPSWTYSAATQAADGVSAPFEIHVAQLSQSFGPGLFTRREINV